ncbi:MAG: hypothetical protein AB7E79_06600 [Rhodospirillaceae bacterium]
MTAADKAETSFLIDAASPAKAAEEAVLRCADPAFVALEIYDGPVRVHQRELSRNTSSPPTHVGGL